MTFSLNSCWEMRIIFFIWLQGLICSTTINVVSLGSSFLKYMNICEILCIHLFTLLPKSLGGKEVAPFKSLVH